ncbi:hypothetical protein LCL97_08925 [Seohaeicola saemankumensis]|nr:hypothetical protein [Seohaeicola saemankumensis]MCA0870946.1 hypothetical protein [Seohaeicola saemankumensis]
MPLITRWSDIATAYPDGLTPAEEQLIAACQAGEECKLEDGKLPLKGPPSPTGDTGEDLQGPPSPTRAIRADLLRYLILGGCEECRVNGWGVQMEGAHVTGPLDLSFAQAKGVTGLPKCRFDRDITALQFRFELLNLSHSILSGLDLQGAVVNGSVFLRQIIANGKVDINGATIGGQLDCDGATFETFYAPALDAEGVRVTGSVFLRQVTARTTVDVRGAIIGGQLACDDARFNATEGAALAAQRLKVTEGLFWRGVSVANGRVGLDSAHVGDLVDDLDSWPPEGRLILDGFTYDRISGAFTDAHSRITWLERGTTWEDEFYPQPFTQLAKVLHEMGHEGDARKVLLHREKLLGRHARARALAEQGRFTRLKKRLAHPFRVFWDRALRYVAGYGYAPFRSIGWLVFLILLATFPANRAWKEGSFAPNSGPVLVSEDWQTLAKSEANPAAVWSGDALPAPMRALDPPPQLDNWRAEAPGRDWETFNRYAWAADLVIPIIDLGQTDAWAPSTTRQGWGKALYWLRWVFILAGWLVTALGAAAITGLIRRD